MGSRRFNIMTTYESLKRDKKLYVKRGAETTQTFASGFGGPWDGIAFTELSGFGLDEDGADNSGGAFNPTTGLFTAPRDGIYEVSMDLILESAASMAAGTTFSIESRINGASIGNSTVLARFHSLESVIAAGRDINLHGSCTFKLNKDDTLDFIVRGSFGTGPLSIVGDSRTSWITLREV